MNQNKNYLTWWQSLNASERFKLMETHEVKAVSNKLIKKMHTKELDELKNLLEFLEANPDEAGDGEIEYLKEKITSFKN